MTYFIIGIVVLFIIIIVLFLLKYFKLKEFDKVILVCINNINESFDRLDKEIVSILDKVSDEKVKDLYKSNKDFSLFEREDMLFEVSWNINKYFDDKEVDEDDKKILRNISNIDEEIEGLKDYYNLNSVRYNELYNKVPFVYIFKLLKLESKKVFKLRKLENYEILKD